MEVLVVCPEVAKEPEFWVTVEGEKLIFIPSGMMPLITEV